jgi:medium-chain acyl-[acyl-carrier-protein] hydrolase
MIENNWFVHLKTHSDNFLRIFCFHYAGGGSSVYRLWGDHIIDGVDLIAIQLPGRENRFGESLIKKIDSIIETLYNNFLGLNDKPYIFFGHSLGALVAFEFARKLQQQNHPNLKHLIVSGSRAPHLPIRRKPIYNLPDQALLKEIRKYNGIPQDLLIEKELLMEIMLPIIRADFTISDLYQCSPEIKLKTPITAFGGIDDNTFPFEDLLKWELHTDIFNYECFTGNHFFIKSSFQKVIKSINAILAKELSL